MLPWLLVDPLPLFAPPPDAEARAAKASRPWLLSMLLCIDAGLELSFVLLSCGDEGFAAAVLLLLLLLFALRTTSTW